MSKKRTRKEQKVEVESIKSQRRNISKTSFNFNMIPKDVVTRIFEFLLNSRNSNKDLACICRTNKDFYSIYRKIVPSKTIYIHAYAGNDTKGDGTLLNPLKTMEQLREASFWKSRKQQKLSGKYDDETEVQIIQCNRKKCELLICKHSKCSKKVCREHKNGRAVYDHEFDEWLFREYAVCSIKNCDVAFCDEHCEGPMDYFLSIPIGRSNRLKGCEVCENFSQAEANLGMYNTPGQRPLCNGHSKICRMVFVESLEDWYHPDDQYCGDFDPHEWNLRNACGFTCCPYHYENHTCGDDPTEYT